MPMGFSAVPPIHIHQAPAHAHIVTTQVRPLRGKRWGSHLTNPPEHWWEMSAPEQLLPELTGFRLVVQMVICLQRRNNDVCSLPGQMGPGRQLLLTGHVVT